MQRLNIICALKMPAGMGNKKSKDRGSRHELRIRTVMLNLQTQNKTKLLNNKPHPNMVRDKINNNKTGNKICNRNIWNISADILLGVYHQEIPGISGRWY